jgi:hypothetical protein
VAEHAIPNLGCCCPYCRHGFDASTNVDGDGQPKPGGLMLCINCAALLVLDEHLQPGEPTPQLVAQVMGDPESRRRIIALRKGIAAAAVTAAVERASGTLSEGRKT